MSIKKHIIFLLSITFAIMVNAQTNKNANQNSEEFIQGNNIYKTGSNWLKIGQGVGYNLHLKSIENNTILSYSFRIKKNYFQAGYHVSSDEFFTKKSLQKLIDFYLTYGKRKETTHTNFAYFAGISYAYGGIYDHTEIINNKKEVYYRGFTQPGVFIIVDYTYKFFYDIGIGTSLYMSYNQDYRVVGLQLHFYLSGAYKGTIK